MSQSKTIIIIPARLHSVRLPKKPLIKIEDNTPMIIKVYQQALKADLGKVLVAGCDAELETLVKSYGYDYIDTDPALPSGTDRVVHGYKALKEEYNNVINLQGDMPHIKPETIIAVNDILNNTNDIDIATAATPILDLGSIDDRNVVKAIITYKNIALYFTRAPIKLNKNYKHIGIYGFKAEGLRKFVSLPQSSLEKQESLEQLRALENDMKIKVAVVDDPNISIDTENDLLKSEQYLKSQVKN